MQDDLAGTGGGYAGIGMPEPELRLRGVQGSPNIQGHPNEYELENEATDPNGLIEAAIWRLAPWRGRVVLDLGAGTGFHVPRFHHEAAHVIALEPHAQSRLRAMRRVADLGLERASVLAGSAEEVPLADGSVDLVHARFAYFFGPRSEAGVAEVARVLRPGGSFCVIDNDWEEGTFATWLRLAREREGANAAIDPAATRAFWSERGFSSTRIASEWRFASRADLETVLRIEFPAASAEEMIRGHQGCSVDYVYRLYHRYY
jgi:SAM-dependent methyltransferase